MTWGIRATNRTERDDLHVKQAVQPAELRVLRLQTQRLTRIERVTLVGDCSSFELQHFLIGHYEYVPEPCSLPAFCRALPALPVLEPGTVVDLHVRNVAPEERVCELHLEGTEVVS